MSKIDYVCPNCGSDSVVRDAWAEWNPWDQKWELQNVFDDAFCNECEGTTKFLKDVPFKEEK